MSYRTLILSLIALCGALALPAIGEASVTQRIWIANGQYTAGAASKQNVVSLDIDGADIQDGPDLGSLVTAITGWRDSLYVGTSAGIVRTDFSGNALATSTSCASPDVMAVDPSAPALYALCQSVGAPWPIMRMPLSTDGSIGAATTVATVANRGVAMSIQGGYLFLAENYPAHLGITRMPLANPSGIQAPWYDAVTPDIIATDADRLFYGSSSGANGSTAVTSRSTPNWQTAAILPAVSTPYLTDIAVRGSLLFSATGVNFGDDTSLYRQSITTLGTPLELVHWTGGLRRITNGFYVGNQEQEWFTDASARALAAGAFTAPIRPSSGLPSTLASATPLVCSITGATVTPLAAGTCTITGEQAGNAAYLTSTGSVSIPITVPATATITKPRFVNGALVTMVKVSGAGSLRQTGSIPRARKVTSKTSAICTARATAKAAGTIKLTCRLNKIGIAHRERGALTVTLTTIFTPTGGTAQTTTQKIKVARAKRS